jgi:glutathione synthase/RimK-type ligase-like ATP-grasp enzyme
MASVAFATYDQEPGISADDALGAEVLRRAGVAVTPAVWDDAGVDWSAFDTVVIRSTWDYHLKAEKFERWLQSLAASGANLWNPPGPVLWNTNKRYLLDLAGCGVNAVPTQYLTAGDRPDLKAILERRGWDEAVVKPAVAVGSHAAWRTSRRTAEADQPRFDGQLGARDVLVQPFLPEVTSQGEWSLVFLGEEYSHAVLKRPACGDFRVQEHLGGSSAPAEADQALIEQAQSALAAVGQPLLYARVDGVAREGQLLLTELEIIEPSLFLGLAPGAGQRFAEAIVRLLRGPVGPPAAAT